MGDALDGIYLDCNATTALAPEVLAAMLPHLQGPEANPASAHGFGRKARQVLEDSRERLAALLGAHPDEVLFTSGATEANNLALLGLSGEPGSHVLASPIEHPSVLEPLRVLANRRLDVEFLPVTPGGRVDPETLAARLTPRTRQVACMLVNHETGVIQPVAEMRKRVRPEIPFHCDAVQAVGKIPVDFRALGVTTLSLSGHKFHGPPGIGALLVQRDAKLRPMLRGGHQQRGLRPGTEPLALIVGLTTALDLACRQRETRLIQARRLRELLLDHLRRHAGPIAVNGEEGSPYVLNLSFLGLAADMVLMALDLAGVACSTGSACSSGSLRVSPVLQAMGVPDEVLRSALRFSFSARQKEAEIREAGWRISNVVRRLRADPGGS